MAGLSVLKNTASFLISSTWAHTGDKPDTSLLNKKNTVKFFSGWIGGLNEIMAHGI